MSTTHHSDCEANCSLVLLICNLRSLRTGIIAFAIIDVLLSRVTSLLYVVSALALSIFIALLNELALLASTNAFIPLISIPPIAAAPCAIAKSGIALYFLDCNLSCVISSLDVTSPLESPVILLGRNASKVILILHSNLAFTLIIMSISCK